MIRTDRLVLRPFRPDDADWVLRISVDAQTARYVELPQPYELRHARYFVEEIAIGGTARGERAEFAVEADGEPVGRVGFGLGNGSAEIGYWLDSSARGHGYATEAARAACAWLFGERRLEIIEWRAEVGNVASRRVAERVGFVVEATLRRRLFHRGVRVDAWVGSLLPSELAYHG